jgi:hypothetical protein
LYTKKLPVKNDGKTKVGVIVGLEVLTAVGVDCNAVFLSPPDDGGTSDLRKTGKLVPDYTVLQPRRQPSSHIITNILP